MGIREIKMNALAYTLLNVSTIKSPSSGRSKYKMIHNTHTYTDLISVCLLVQMNDYGSIARND